MNGFAEGNGKQPLGIVEQHSGGEHMRRDRSTAPEREAPSIGERIASFLSNPEKIAANVSPKAAEGIKQLSQWQEKSKGRTPLPTGKRTD